MFISEAQPSESILGHRMTCGYNYVFTDRIMRKLDRLKAFSPMTLYVKKWHPNFFFFGPGLYRYLKAELGAEGMVFEN